MYYSHNRDKLILHYNLQDFYVTRRNFYGNGRLTFEDVQKSEYRVSALEEVCRHYTKEKNMNRKLLNPKQLIALLLMLVLMISAVPVAVAESFLAYVYPVSMPVYSTAAMTTKIGTLYPYTVFKVVDFNGDLGAPQKVSYNGRTGYALPRYWQGVAENSEEATVNANTKVYLVYGDASSAVSVSAGTKVNVFATNNGMAAIERNGVGAFISVQYLNYEGWSPEDFTGTATAAPTPTPVPEPTRVPSLENAVPGVTVKRTYVYAGKSTGSKYLGVLTPGVNINVVDIEGSWAYIEWKGAFGYCALSCVQPASAVTSAPTPTPEPTKAPSTANSVPGITVKTTRVYAGKSSSTKYLGVLTPGINVNIVETGSNWAYIEWRGAYGYCELSCVMAASQVTPTPKPSLEDAVPGITVKRTYVYAGKSTSTKYLGVLTPGIEVNVLDADTNWAYIEWKGRYGYCAVSCLTPLSATTTPAPEATAPSTGNAVPGITVKQTKVYAGKSTSTKYLGQLTPGIEINIIETGDNWAYIEWKGAYGYCALSCVMASSAVTPTPAPDLSESVPATVIASYVKVYASKSTSSKYLGQLKKGTEVNLVDFDDNWAYIEWKGAYGYCSIAGIMPALSQADAIPAVVSASSLKFYAAPSTSAQGVGTLKKGAKVNVLNMVDGWAFVERNGNYAWCLMSGLTLSEDENENPLAGWTMETFDATVVSSTANIYEDADTGSKSLSVPMGKGVTVIGYKQPWAAVMINDSTIGFMQIDDLSRDVYAGLTTGSSGTDVSTLEKALLSKGYFDDIPDNTYNTYTADAVKLFQAACGMTQTGAADINTLRVLYGTYAPYCSLMFDTYEKGDSGNNVKRIQMRLYALDYLSKAASVDGSYGTNTYNAVKLFQAANGLGASGNVDSNTLKKLYSANAAKLPAGKTAADAINVVTPSTGNQANNSTTISNTLKSTTSTYSSSMSGPQKAEYLIYVGQNQLGKPYVYGATGTSSFDCSGFTWYCFNKVGVTLPRTAYSQGYNKNYERVTKISDLERGALVYFNTVSDSDSCDHAGIYLGAGWFIHASSGQAKVVVSNLSSGYYNGVFSWGHNVL